MEITNTTTTEVIFLNDRQYTRTVNQREEISWQKINFDGGYTIDVLEQEYQKHFPKQTLINFKSQHILTIDELNELMFVRGFKNFVGGQRIFNEVAKTTVTYTNDKNEDFVTFIIGSVHIDIHYCIYSQDLKGMKQCDKESVILFIKTNL